MTGRCQPCAGGNLVSEHVDGNTLVAGIVIEQANVDPAQGLWGFAIQVSNDMEFGMVMVMMVMPMIIVVSVVVAVAAFMVMLVAMIFSVPVVVTVIVVVSMVAAMICIEAMGMGVDAIDLTAAARVGHQPLPNIKKRHRFIEQALLILVTRRMLESDQVDAGNLQLQAQGRSILGKIARAYAMDVGAVVPLELGGSHGDSPKADGGQGRQKTIAIHAVVLHQAIRRVVTR